MLLTRNFFYCYRYKHAVENNGVALITVDMMFYGKILQDDLLCDKDLISILIFICER